jgi:hypothetical protein
MNEASWSKQQHSICKTSYPDASTQISLTSFETTETMDKTFPSQDFSAPHI